uniref:Uncharacterized protein n=1 Tax=Nelumbo nucifera TaxID=4432 RepID=A0A822YTR5_NELNU|nr:TPA_asm: hypothetical protein HUJ06_006682 [Nelumbo nucifera]
MRSRVSSFNLFLPFICAYFSISFAPWKDQITIRGLVVSMFLGTLFCIIMHKLNLTVGIIPSLNVVAGLLDFFFVKSWTGFLSKLGFSIAPFTRQENTVIQSCIVACYGLAFSGNIFLFFLLLAFRFLLYYLRCWSLEALGFDSLVCREPDRRASATGEAQEHCGDTHFEANA